MPNNETRFNTRTLLTKLKEAVDAIDAAPESVRQREPLARARTALNRAIEDLKGTGTFENSTG